MFKIITSVANVKSPLLLKEGTVIAQYNRGELELKLITTGAPIIEFHGEMFDNIEDFPEELTNCINEGKISSVNVVFGSNYELLVSRNNEYVDNEILQDISGYSDNELERMMSETALDYAF